MRLEQQPGHVAGCDAQRGPDGTFGLLPRALAMA